MRKPETQDNLNAGRIEQKEGKTEMEQIQELARMIELLKEDEENFKDDFYSRSREDRKSLPEDYLEQHSRELLDKIFDAIDKMDIWKYKFTSEYKSHDESKDPSKDSVYYMTDDGITLRFKMSLLKSDGLRGVMQPFMEKIFFAPNSKDIVFSLIRGESVDKEKISEVPQEGWEALEFITEKFWDSQRLPAKEGFDKVEPSVELIEEGNKIKLANLRSIGAHHFGHAVHNIESIKK